MQLTEADHEDGLSPIELQVAELLLAAPRPFCMESTIRREWTFETLLNICGWARRRRPGAGAWVYVPPSFPLAFEPLQTLVSRQVDHVSGSDIDWMFFDGCEHQVPTMRETLAHLAGQCGARAHVEVQGSYLGLPDMARAIAGAINLCRRDLGLPDLVEDERLAGVALRHAMDLARRGEMSHRGADGSTHHERVSRQGLDYRAIGENLSLGTADSAEIARLWMASDNHRKNIVAAYDAVGVGVAAATVGDAPQRPVNLSSVALFAAR